MIPEEKLFELFFVESRADGERIFNDSEIYLADIVYDVICDEIREDRKIHGDESGEDWMNSLTDSEISRIHLAAEWMDRVVKLFKISKEARDVFMKCFGDWSSFRQSNIQRLKEIAEEIQTDKFNSDIAKVVGGVVGAVGGVVVGLSFLTPLAAITLPLAIGGGVASAVGGGVVVGTTGTEIVLLKNNVEEAKVLIMQDQAKLSTMTPWITHTTDLKKAMEHLVSYSQLKGMSEILKDFHDINAMNLKVVGYVNRFKNVLKLCIGRMRQCEIIEKFGSDVAPVVMTFIVVVCLLRYHNRMVLDCALQVDRYVVGMMSMVDIGVQAARLSAGLATKGGAAAGRAMPIIIASSVFVAAGIAIDVLNVVWSSIDIHTRSVPEHAKKMKKAAEMLEKEYLGIKSIYDSLKNERFIDPTDVTDWKSFVIQNIPNDSEQIDLKATVRSYLPEEAWGCIKLQRLPTEGNNWFVKVPVSQSQKLSQLTYLTIKKDRCLIMK